MGDYILKEEKYLRKIIEEKKCSPRNYTKALSNGVVWLIFRLLAVLFNILSITQ